MWIRLWLWAVIVIEPICSGTDLFLLREGACKKRKWRPFHSIQFLSGSKHTTVRFSDVLINWSALLRKSWFITRMMKRESPELHKCLCICVGICICLCICSCICEIKLIWQQFLFAARERRRRLAQPRWQIWNFFCLQTTCSRQISSWRTFKKPNIPIKQKSNKYQTNIKQIWIKLLTNMKLPLLTNHPFEKPNIPIKRTSNKY